MRRLRQEKQAREKGRLYRGVGGRLDVHQAGESPLFVLFSGSQTPLVFAADGTVPLQPVHDCRSRQILDYLASLRERYEVLARDVAEDKVTHLPQSSSSNGSCAEKRCSCARNEMPLARVRSGMSPVERKGAKWTTTTGTSKALRHFRNGLIPVSLAVRSPVLPTDTILASLSGSSSPETRFHDQPYQDVLEAVVLDASPYSSATHDSWLAFATQVADDLLAAQGYACFDTMFADRLQSAVACGDVSSSTASEHVYCRRKQDSPSSGNEDDTARSRAGAERRSSSPLAAEPLARSLFREEERVGAVIS